MTIIGRPVPEGAIPVDRCETLGYIAGFNPQTINDGPLTLRGRRKQQHQFDLW